MGLNFLRHDWHLFEITGIFKGFDQMVIADSDSMIKYYLEPGNYISLHNLDLGNHSKSLTFILMPYIKNYGDNYELIKELKIDIKDLIKHHEQSCSINSIVNKNYLQNIKELEFSFYISRLSTQRFKVQEDLDKEQDDLLKAEESQAKIAETENYTGKLAVPESWFKQNCSHLGEIVLLRKRN